MNTTPANLPIFSTVASKALRSEASRSTTTSYLPRVGKIRLTPFNCPKNSTTSSNLPCVVLIKTHAESKESTSSIEGESEVLNDLPCYVAPASLCKSKIVSVSARLFSVLEQINVTHERQDASVVDECGTLGYGVYFLFFRKMFQHSVFRRLVVGFYAEVH